MTAITTRVFVALSLLLVCVSATPSYFPIVSPVLNQNWTSNGLNVVKWYTAKEGIQTVDMQLVRLSTDGIIPIAQTIPSTWLGLNVQLSGVPEGDDYFILLLDSAGGDMYSLSPRFSITSSGTAAPSALASPVATATATGSPNPTQGFFATFAASSAFKTNPTSLIAPAIAVTSAIVLAVSSSLLL